jgi:hypothetical protein
MTLVQASIYFSVMLAAGLPAWTSSNSSTSRGPASSVAFLPNSGQWPIPDLWVARRSNMLVRAQRDGILFQLFEQVGEPRRGVLLHLHSDAPPAGSVPQREDELATRWNFYLGNDPAHWQSGLRPTSAVRYCEFVPGIDLVLHGSESGAKYDLLVAPGADLSQVVLRVEGADLVHLGDAGELRIETALGTLTMQLGECWEVLRDGAKRTRSMTYRLEGPISFGIDVECRDPSLELVIDPGLHWATYLGSAGGGTGDYSTAIARDGDGSVTVTGWCDGTDFPTTPGAYVTTNFSQKAVFVSKLDPSGSALVYSSVLGGAGGESRAFAIGLDGRGRATVAARTFASDFPKTAGSFDPTPNTAGVVLRLDELGALVYSTGLGSTNGGTEIHALGVAPSGATVVGGWVGGTTFPTTPGSFQPNLTASGPAFVTRLNPDGSALEWSTFLNGNGLDEIWALALDEKEQVTVVGRTTSRRFPTTPGAFMTAPPPFPYVGTDGFVTRLNAQGSALLWSTYLGGGSEDVAAAVAVDRQGGVVVAGYTSGASFPTTPGCFQPQAGGPGFLDGFVTRLDPTGSSLVYSTFLGGPFLDVLAGVSVDRSGVVTVAGTAKSGFPITPGALDPVASLDVKMVVARLNPSGTKLYASTFYGGPGNTGATASTMGPSGTVSLTGPSSPGFPTTPGSYAPNYQGGQSDAAVATLDLVLEGIRLYGASTPSCNGPLILNATRMPIRGERRFGLYGSQAPDAAIGWLLFGKPVAAPSDVGGAELWLDRSAPILRMPVHADSAGFLEITLPLSSIAPGTSFACQLLFANPAGCGGSAFSSSNALVVTVQ